MPERLILTNRVELATAHPGIGQDRAPLVEVAVRFPNYWTFHALTPAQAVALAADLVAAAVDATEPSR